MKEYKLKFLLIQINFGSFWAGSTDSLEINSGIQSFLYSDLCFFINAQLTPSNANTPPEICSRKLI